MSLEENKPIKKLTICEIHRQLYRTLKDHHMTDDIRAKLEMAFLIGKKMHYRLAKYKFNWEEDVFREELGKDTDTIDQDKPIVWQDWYTNKKKKK